METRHCLARLAERTGEADATAGDAIVPVAATSRALECALGGLAFAVELVEPQERRRVHVHVGLLRLVAPSFEACRHATGGTVEATSAILRIPIDRDHSFAGARARSDPLRPLRAAACQGIGVQPARVDGGASRPRGELRERLAVED